MKSPYYMCVYMYKHIIYKHTIFKHMYLPSLFICDISFIINVCVSVQYTYIYVFVQVFCIYMVYTRSSQVTQSGKEPSCQCRRYRRRRFDPWIRKIPWRRAQKPTPVFLPGESNGQRSLMGYSPQGCKKLDTTEATQHTCTVICTISGTNYSRSPIDGRLGCCQPE